MPPLVGQGRVQCAGLETRAEQHELGVVEERARAAGVSMTRGAKDPDAAWRQGALPQAQLVEVNVAST